MNTPVYTKMDAREQLFLLSRQLGIIQYHLEVEPQKAAESGKIGGSH